MYEPISRLTMNEVDEVRRLVWLYQNSRGIIADCSSIPAATDFVLRIGEIYDNARARQIRASVA